MLRRLIKLNVTQHRSAGPAGGTPALPGKPAKSGLQIPEHPHEWHGHVARPAGGTPNVTYFSPIQAEARLRAPCKGAR